MKDLGLAEIRGCRGRAQAEGLARGTASDGSSVNLRPSYLSSSCPSTARALVLKFTVTRVHRTLTSVFSGDKMMMEDGQIRKYEGTISAASCLSLVKLSQEGLGGVVANKTVTRAPKPGESGCPVVKSRVLSPNLFSLPLS